MRIATFALTVSLALAGTIAFAQNVTFDFDQATDFSRLRTYAWVRGTTLDDELNHRRIVSAVEAELAAKGLARVEAGASPDLLVAYHASFDRDLQINGFSSGWGGFRFGGNRSKGFLGSWAPKFRGFGVSGFQSSEVPAFRRSNPEPQNLRTPEPRNPGA